MHFSVILNENILLPADSSTDTSVPYDVDLNSGLPIHIPQHEFSQETQLGILIYTPSDPYYPLDLSPATSVNPIGPSFEVLNYFHTKHSSQPHSTPNYEKSF
jgi:hypothetical protein